MMNSCVYLSQPHIILHAFSSWRWPQTQSDIGQLFSAHAWQGMQPLMPCSHSTVPVLILLPLVPSILIYAINRRTPVLNRSQPCSQICYFVGLGVLIFTQFRAMYLQETPCAHSFRMQRGSDIRACRHPDIPFGEEVQMRGSDGTEIRRQRRHERQPRVRRWSPWA